MQDNYKTTAQLASELAELRQRVAELEAAEAARKRAEEALRESEERFSTAFRFSPMAITIIRAADGRFVDVNDFFVKISGYTREEIIGHTVDELHLYADPEERELNLQALRERGLLETFEFKARRKSGEVIVGLGATTTISLGGEKHHLSLVVDITERKRAEEALAHERNLLRTLIDNLPDYIYVKDAEGRFVVANMAVVRQVGFASQDELVGKSDFDLFPRELAARYYADEQAIIQSGQGMYDYEGSTVDANKEEKDRWVSTIKVPLRDAQGKIMGFVGIGRDITERKRAELALREREAMLAQTEGIAHVGSWEWDVATDTVVWSDELFRIFQLDPDQGAPSFAEHPKLYLPEDMQHLQQAVETAVADGTPYELEMRAIRTDGEIRHCLARGHAEMGPEGKATRLFGSLQDITERKCAEEALRVSEEKYRSIVETTAEWIWEIDLTGRHTFSNPGVTAILGYRLEEFIGQSASSLLHAEDRTEVETTLPRLIAEKRGWRGWVLRWRHKDGSYRYLESNASPIINAAGELVGYLGADRDITERKRAEAQLNEQLDELRRWHKATLGRETRILDLKREVNELLAQVGKPPRYPSAETENQ